MKKVVSIAVALLICLAGWAQDTVKVYTGLGAPMNSRSYKFPSAQFDSSIWVRNVARFDDSVSFGKRVYVPIAPAGDSSNQAASTAWAKRNISPGVPGQPVSAWPTAGVTAPSIPSPYKLGYLDSTALPLVTNNITRLTIPDNGIKRSAGASQRVLMYDTIAPHNLYYTDIGGGGGATPTLQQVTVAGNSTDQGINFIADASNPVSGVSIGAVTDQIAFTGPTFAIGWDMSVMDADAAFIIPTGSFNRVIPLSVNGNFANAAGEITVAAGGGTVTSVSGTAPVVVVNGTTTPAISMKRANATDSGFLRSSDWTIFNNKLDALTNGSGTTANGTAVDLGGNLTGVAQIGYNGFTFEIGAGSVNAISASSDSVTIGDFGGSGNSTQFIVKDATQTAELKNGTLISHNIIGITDATQTAAFTAIAGTAYVLPDAPSDPPTVTITMPTLVEGDIFEFYNTCNHGTRRWVSDTVIYLADGVTTFTTLTNQTNYIIRYVGGKLRVSN